jgi:hypothetical protein
MLSHAPSRGGEPVLLGRGRAPMAAIGVHRRNRRQQEIRVGSLAVEQRFRSPALRSRLLDYESLRGVQVGAPTRVLTCENMCSTHQRRREVLGRKLLRTTWQRHHHTEAYPRRRERTQWRGLDRVRREPHPCTAHDRRSACLGCEHFRTTRQRHDHEPQHGAGQSQRSELSTSEGVMGLTTPSSRFRTARRSRRAAHDAPARFRAHLCCSISVVQAPPGARGPSC